MVKQDNPYKVYKNLSRNESILLDIVDEFAVFSIAKIRRLTGWKQFKICNTLTSLKKKRFIIAVKKDNYVLASKIPENIFKIATLITQPSYVSFWAAMSYYGFTEQQLSTIQVVSTKQYPKINLLGHNIETTTLQPNKFYGYHSINGFVIAEKERLIVDCLYKPEKAGGMDELRKCIRNCWSEIDQEKLFHCLEKFNNKSLFAKLGYLLEELGIKNEFKEKYLKLLPKAYIKLNPSRQNKNNLSKAWLVDIND